MPNLTFSNESCKCPGQSQQGEEFVYYLQFCVTDNANCPAGQGATFTITKVTKSNNTLLDGAPNACFPETLPSTPVAVGTCTTEIFRFASANSSNWLDVTFTITNSFGTTEFTARVPNPPNCSDIAGLAQRCEACTP